MVEALDREGYVLVPGVVAAGEVETLVTEVERAARAPGTGGRDGLRSLFASLPRVRALAASDPVRGLAEGVLGPGCFAVRAILFDKNYPG